MRFRFRISPGNTADGFTFCIQGGDPKAVGDPAGGLGYQDIPNSVAVKFDLYGNDGEGPNSTGLFLNGAKPTNPGAIDLTPSGVDLHGGRAYDATIDYKNKKLTLNIVDAEEKGKKFTHTFDVDVPAAVHGTTALVGFTGGTGGASANQDICRGRGNRRRRRINHSRALSIVVKCDEGEVVLQSAAPGKARLLAQGVDEVSAG